MAAATRRQAKGVKKHENERPKKARNGQHKKFAKTSEVVKNKLRAGSRGGGGSPIWSCPSFFVPFWDFPDFSRNFPTWSFASLSAYSISLDASMRTVPQASATQSEPFTFSQKQTKEAKKYENDRGAFCCLFCGHCFQ